MKHILDDGRHRFEIVDSVPSGYLIWNIGRNMTEGYVPFCQLKSDQPFEGGMEINPDTLKAVRIDDSFKIMDAIGYGPNTSEEMEAFINKYQDCPENSWKHLAVQRMKDALPVMRQIKWE